MPGKRSQHELKRLVEQAVAEVCGLPRPGLWFCVDRVEARGRPPEVLRVWATLHFLPEGSPFCCGEAGCHLGLHGEILEEVGDRIRRAMGLRQRVTVELGDRIGVRYHPGVSFHHGITRLANVPMDRSGDSIMSYCLHITRSDSWTDGDRRIRREEWARVAAADPELEIYEEMQSDEDDPVYRLERPGLDVAFSHEERTGTIDVSCGYFEDVLPKVLEIAARLAAVVQGDGLEYYRMTESGRETTDVRPDPAA